ncbi:MAG: N-formylglutamate amidohydrolase, partial [Sphingomonadaceae bacterium]|nr:N-formylglutamate amidohydrolase [Sphingomonadaceae bacterium]
GPEDPAPVALFNPHGRAPFLLLGDHAGIAIPARLGNLGLGAADLARHIAWDIGVRGLGEALAARLDAVFLHQLYSRLVVDCNRAPHASDAMPERSDGTDIPGNVGLSAAERTARVSAIHAPYQAAIATEIAGRTDPPILVSLHSFTPVMAGKPRPWEIGILHDGGDARFARAMLDVLRARGDLSVGDNEPYRMDLIDYTVPLHAYPAGLRYAEIEIRQDLIGDAAGQQRWAAIVGDTLLAAEARLG